MLNLLTFETDKNALSAHDFFYTLKLKKKRIPSPIGEGGSLAAR